MGLGPYTGAGIGSVGRGSQVVLLVRVGLPKWVRLGIHAGGPSFACATAEASGMCRVPAIGFELFSETGFRDETKLTSTQRSSTWEGLSPKLSESSREKEKDKSLRGTRDSRGDSPAKARGIQTGGSGSRFDWHPDKPATSNVRYSPDRR